MLLGIREANDVEGEVERYLTDIYIVEIYLLCAKKKKKKCLKALQPPLSEPSNHCPGDELRLACSSSHVLC